MSKSIPKVDLREFEPRYGHRKSNASTLLEAESSDVVDAATVPTTVVLQDTVQPMAFELGYTKRDQGRIHQFQQAALGKQRTNDPGKISKVEITAGEAALLAATEGIAKKKKMSFSFSSRRKVDQEKTSPEPVHLSLVGTELEAGGLLLDGGTGGAPHEIGDASETSSSSGSDDVTEQQPRTSHVFVPSRSPSRQSQSIFKVEDMSLFERLNGPAAGGSSKVNHEPLPTLTTVEIDDVIEHVLFSTDLLKQNLFTLLDLFTTATEEKNAAEEFSKRWQGVLEFDVTKDALQQLDRIQLEIEEQSASPKKKRQSKSSFSQQVSQLAKNTQRTSQSPQITSPESGSPRAAAGLPSPLDQHRARHDFLSKVRSIVHSAFLYTFQEVCLRHQERNQHAISHRSLFQVVERSMEVENEAVKLAQSNKLLQSKLDAAMKSITSLKISKEQSLREYLTELQQVRQRLEEMQRLHGGTEVAPKLLSGVDRGPGGLGNTYSSMNTILGGSSSRDPFHPSSPTGMLPTSSGDGAFSELSPEDRHLKFLNRKLTVECAVLNHSLSQRATTIRALERELETTNAAFAKSRLELAKTLQEQEQVDNTLAEAVNLASALTDLRAKCTDLETECEERRENMADLTQRLARQEEEYASLDSTFQNNLKAHAVEVQELRDAIHTGTVFIEEEFRIQLKDMQRDHAEQTAELHATIGELEGTLERKESERFRLETEVGEYHLKLDEAHNELSVALMQLSAVKAQVESQKTYAEVTAKAAEFEEEERRAEERPSSPFGSISQRPPSANSFRLPSSPSNSFRRASLTLEDHQRDREAYADAKIAVVAAELHEEALRHHSTTNAFDCAKRLWSAERDALVVDLEHKEKALEALQRYVNIVEDQMKKSPKGGPTSPKLRSSDAPVASPLSIEDSLYASVDVVAAQRDLKETRNSLHQSSKNLKARIKEQADEDLREMRQDNILTKRKSMSAAAFPFLVGGAMSTLPQRNEVAESVNSSPRSSLVESSPKSSPTLTWSSARRMNSGGIGRTSPPQSPPKASRTTSGLVERVLSDKITRGRRNSIERLRKQIEPLLEGNACATTTTPLSTPPLQISRPSSGTTRQILSRTATMTTHQGTIYKLDASPTHISEDARDALRDALSYINRRDDEIVALESIVSDQQTLIEQLREAAPLAHLQHRTNVTLAEPSTIADSANVTEPILIGRRYDFTRMAPVRPVVHSHHHTTTTTHVTNTSTEHNTIVLLDDAQAGAYRAAAKSLKAIRDLQQTAGSPDGTGETSLHRQSIAGQSTGVVSSLEEAFPGLEYAAEHFDLFQSALALQTQLHHLIDVSKNNLDGDHRAADRVAVFRSLQSTVRALQNRLSKKKESIVAKRQDELETVLASTQAINRSGASNTSGIKDELGRRTFGGSTPIPRHTRLSSPYGPTAVVTGAGVNVVQGPLRANPLINRVPLQTSQMELVQGTQISRPQSSHDNTGNVSAVSRTRGPDASRVDQLSLHSLSSGAQLSIGVLQGVSVVGSSQAGTSLDTTLASTQGAHGDTFAAGKGAISRPIITSTRVARPSTATAKKSKSGSGAAGRPASSLGPRTL